MVSGVRVGDTVADPGFQKRGGCKIIKIKGGGGCGRGYPSRPARGSGGAL